MADTTTTNYSLTKPEVGASEDTWGTKLNTNLDTIDAQMKTNADAIAVNASAIASNTNAINNIELFPTGTAMLFQQTSAPTGWTKSTTHNDKALRVVSGTASSGGSVAFTTAFASKTPSGSVTITSVTGSAGATTLSNSQIPSHSHSVGLGSGNTGNTNRLAGWSNNRGNTNTGNSGGGGSHSHSFSFSSGSGTFSGNAIDLSVQYVDLIIATKD